MNGLDEALTGYLTLRRGFGFKLTSQEARLRSFTRFLAERNATVVTAKLAVEWAGGGCGSPTWASRLSTVRSFCRHLANLDARTEIPPQKVFPPQRRPTPYIFSEAEVLDLVATARAWPTQYPFQSHSLHCAFGLLAATGMRSGEVFNLQRNDVDLREGLLQVRQSKFGKSRIVPIDGTTAEALERYATRRDNRVVTCSSPFFIVGDRGAALRHDSVHRVFMGWAYQTGLRTKKKRGGPRLHDLRHTFAVRTLTEWYRAGEDIDRLLPVLSTYLGHTHTRDTYWYLTATPELLGHAAAKLDQHWEARL
ncbi:MULTISPECIES: tyrosine-type recombinase/integrase [unclassified Novosphingobium]|uniref:tyrosine-type recombinase/integrase n=1 Tax=unclassified Novosphingobium TaxID=2644732 RepID=UPI00146C43B1|nr:MULTISPECIES: tyrosine-type recombinase/integrase [unclassified Novosphingobium]NMN06824.1 integrase [Novosphingobium sp. SG919]NMN88726.1 integrase [Novosphingobium sp. SG916]